MASVKKIGENKYEIRAYFGYDGEFKQNRRAKTITVAPGLTPLKLERELERQKKIFDQEVRDERDTNVRITLSAFIVIWMRDYAEIHLAPKTLHSYKALVKVIIGPLGSIKLARLKPTDILRLYTDLSSTPVRDQRYRPRPGLSARMASMGMKTPQLSARAKVSQSSVRSALHGHCLNERNARALSEALGTRMQDAFEPIDQNKMLSGNSVLHVHRLLHSILETAVLWAYIPSNPASRVRAPHKSRHDIEFLDDVQARRLIELLQAAPIFYRTAIILLLHFGLRRGELLGLFWSDIDFEKSVIHIHRSLQYLPERGCFLKEPKSSSSIRPLKMTATIAAILREYRQAQLEQRLASGEAWHEEDLVFCRTDGTYFRPDLLTVWFKKFAVQNGMPPCHLHSLRHTFATLQIHAGVSISTVSRRLGHADQATTLGTYLHQIQSAEEAAVEALENVLTAPKSETGA